jgi:hypothetical protein
MSAQNLSLLFRSVSLLFLILLVIAIYHTFKKTGKKKLARGFGLAAFICFIGVVYLVFYGAQNDSSLAAFKANPENQAAAAAAEKNVPQNVIYKDVTFLISIMVRVVIVSIISFMLYYLLRRSKKYPNILGIKIHRVLLWIGFGLIGWFVVYETLECINSESYREIIPLGLYSAFFAGGMFWMLVCSIVSAASLPEDWKA